MKSASVLDIIDIDKLHWKFRWDLNMDRCLIKDITLLRKHRIILTVLKSFIFVFQKFQRYTVMMYNLKNKVCVYQIYF